MTVRLFALRGGAGKEISVNENQSWSTIGIESNTNLTI
jgi:hypothetical protein